MRRNYTTRLNTNKPSSTLPSGVLAILHAGTNPGGLPHRSIRNVFTGPVLSLYRPSSCVSIRKHLRLWLCGLRLAKTKDWTPVFSFYWKLPPAWTRDGILEPCHQRRWCGHQPSQSGHGERLDNPLT